MKSMSVSQNGLPSELLEELPALAVEKVRGEGLRLMGEGGLLPELAQHLMQAALETEMDEHLAAEAGRAGRRGSRSGARSSGGRPRRPTRRRRPLRNTNVRCQNPAALQCNGPASSWAATTLISHNVHGQVTPGGGNQEPALQPVH
ncbi:hypothetical protein ACFCZT_16865 [Streptomyces sp. NPDC056230]|uniref:hypothetical protein n=1 Tax=unclassified Streptomyces TaxID=2593676 RepID=UPI0035E3745A